MVSVDFGMLSLKWDVCIMLFSSSQGSGVYYAEEGVERFYEQEVVDDFNRADAHMNAHTM